MVAGRIKGWVKSCVKSLNNLNPFKLKREVDTLYELLYSLTHDLQGSLQLTALQTRAAFANQWRNLEEGQYLLSDPWFKQNVARILSTQELQLKPEWFRGKSVLDVGCGNGRWSYGFAELGANITAVDVNPVAIEKTTKAVSSFNVRKEFHVSAVEELSRNLPARKYDLVFCWGVLHHCRSFTQSLDELVKIVDDKGILYLYLYGRESVPYASDIELFKERVRYNTLPAEDEKYRFLLQKTKNDRGRVHNFHDVYAPLINRRLEYGQIEQMLRSRGFREVTRTIDHSELFIRASRSELAHLGDSLLPPCRAPYWFQHHQAA